MDVPQLGDLAKRRRITKSVTTLASIPIPNSTMTKDRLLRDMMNLSRVDCEAERKAEAVMSAETPVTNFSSCMLTIPTSASNLLKVFTLILASFPLEIEVNIPSDTWREVHALGRRYSSPI